MQRNKVIKLFAVAMFVLLATLLLLSWELSNIYGPCASTQDSWYNPGPLEVESQFKPVPKTDYCLVTPSLRSKAVELLETEAVIELTEDEAQVFSNAPVAHHEQCKPFLVRALMLNSL